MNPSRPLRHLSLAIAALVLFAAALAPSALNAAAKKVDINSASQQELEALPGVGEATAKKIIAGRPYGSVADLSKAGVSESTIQKISGMVKAGRSKASASTSTSSKAKAKAKEKAPAESASAKPEKSEKPAKAEKVEKAEKTKPTEKSGTSTSSASSASSAPKTAPAGSAASVDLNTASQKELEALPGVGEVTAKKIIAGRPYFSVADVSRAGVSSATMSKISKLVYVSAPITTSRSTSTTSSSSSSSPSSSSPSTRSSAPPPPASSASSDSSSSSSPSAPAASSSRPAPRTEASAEAPYQAPPSPGMVWVNLDTKIFHRQGDHWYGKTKHGQYMTEADAVKAGYRVSKEKGEPAAR